MDDAVPDPLDDVLLVSVPEHERGYLDETLPGATAVADSLSPELGRRHADVRILSVMVHDMVDAAALDAFDRLDAVVTRSAGFDHLPLDWFEAHDVPAYALGGYSTSSVTHLALGMILALLYRMPEAMSETQGAFRGGSDPPGWDRSGLAGRHLEEVTIGVVGTGRIGGHLVRTLSAMGARSLGFDIAPDKALAKTPRFEYVDGLDALLAASDVVTLHVPLTDRTAGMIGRTQLGLLPKGAVLVNTCRGEVVSQAAVAEALDSGRLAGYAADTMPEEPDPPALGRFADRPDVLLTPHLAAYNPFTIRARYETTARVVRAVLDGRLSDVVDLRVA